jgi:hypothetical protein
MLTPQGRLIMAAFIYINPKGRLNGSLHDYILAYFASSFCQETLVL